MLSRCSARSYPGLHFPYVDGPQYCSNWNVESPNRGLIIVIGLLVTLALTYRKACCEDKKEEWRIAAGATQASG